MRVWAGGPARAVNGVKRSNEKLLLLCDWTRPVISLYKGLHAYIVEALLSHLRKEAEGSFLMRVWSSWSNNQSINLNFTKESHRFWKQSWKLMIEWSNVLDLETVPI